MKVNKKIIFAVFFLVVLVGGFIIVNRQKSSQKQVTIKEVEKTASQGLSLKEAKSTVPDYPTAKRDEDKCGKDAFYVQEKSADFVKNYCKFLRDNNWKLVHQDYPTCEDIKSFGGGYNYEKDGEKIAVSVIRYGEDATCFWIYSR